MKNILNKIVIHSLFYVITIIMLLTGLFKNFILFIFIIITHEMGHLISSLLFRWNIEKIILLPFGGLIIFREDINKPLLEELIIALSGSIFQVIILLIFPVLKPISIPLLLFNLLPIYPLDGFKIINIFINYLFSFMVSYKISLIISLILIIIIFFINHNLIIVLSLLLMLYHTSKSFIDRYNYFNKFLLERYLNKYKFKKVKTIKNINNMYRDNKHLFITNNGIIDEEKLLKKIYRN